MPDPERSENGRRKFVFLVHAGSRIHARGIDSCLLSSPFNTRFEMEANKNARDQTGHATSPSSSAIFHFREMRDAICGKKMFGIRSCSWGQLVLLRSHRDIDKGLRSDLCDKGIAFSFIIYLFIRRCGRACRATMQVQGTAHCLAFCSNREKCVQPNRPTTSIAFFPIEKQQNRGAPNH